VRLSNPLELNRLTSASDYQALVGA
jgi:hypothetical protein